MKTIASAFALVVVLVVSVAWWQRGAVVQTMLPNLMAKAVQARLADKLGDGLHIVLCGAGGPLYDAKRSAPCLLVLAGDTQLLIDAGAGAARNLARFRFDVGELDGVLLTHFHSDHIDGLGELSTIRWVQRGNTDPLTVIGPEGVTEVVAGFNVAYQQDQDYRHDHHGDEVADKRGAGMRPAEFEIPAEGTSWTVVEKDGLTVDMFRVDHAPVTAAVGYRIRYQGRTVVVSGDTSRSANLVEMTRGADLLVHEALSESLVGEMQRTAEAAGNSVVAKITHDIPDYHTTPTVAAEIAAEAEVEHLLLYHIVPALPLPGMDQIFLDGVAERFDDVTLGQDGTVVSLESGGASVTVSQL